jgi:60 kDa SS-A/Ro ribonucleoprotein
MTYVKVSACIQVGTPAAISLGATDESLPKKDNTVVNLQLFQSIKRAILPTPTALNAEGVPAYAFDARHQLAQLAATGCLNRTFYANAQEQLEIVQALCQELDPPYLAKVAIYGRQAGHMKDMPALLAAILAVRDIRLLTQVFPRIIDNGKMLRNFVQIVRSGVLGRKSLGSRPKKLVQNWLLTASEQQLLHAAVGNSPSLADVVKMVHPKPSEAWRASWFAWLLGKPFEEASLPPLTRSFEAFKRDSAQGVALDVPEVPFQMLTALNLSRAQWAQIARIGSWQMVRQNLNTFARHGVFEVAGMIEAIAAKLRDGQAISRARVFPYQLMSAWKATFDAVPHEVRNALQDAMEISLENIPHIDGRIVVCPDVSGSMSSAVTGHRGSATSSVRCIDVAALVAAALLRKNPNARILPFEQTVVKLPLNERDTVMTNAQILASVGGGGTNCSAPIALLNAERSTAELVILVSDNESWIDAKRSGATQTLREWEIFKQRNPRARLVCIDIAPTTTTQAKERHDILNIGGFSDAVFGTVADFAAGKLEAGHWVGEIEKVSLVPQ